MTVIVPLLALSLTIVCSAPVKEQVSKRRESTSEILALENQLKKAAGEDKKYFVGPNSRPVPQIDGLEDRDHQIVNHETELTQLNPEGHVDQNSQPESSVLVSDQEPELHDDASLSLIPEQDPGLQDKQQQQQPTSDQHQETNHAQPIPDQLSALDHVMNAPGNKDDDDVGDVQQLPPDGEAVIESMPEEVQEEDELREQLDQQQDIPEEAYEELLETLKIHPEWLRSEKDRLKFIEN